MEGIAFDSSNSLLVNSQLHRGGYFEQHLKIRFHGQKMEEKKHDTTEN